MSDQRNIFIGHYCKDDVHVQALKESLKVKGYNVRNFSVDSTKHKDGRRPTDAVIRRYLDMRIKWSSTFICLIGPQTHTREWVNYEIRRAHVSGKRIVGIYTPDANGSTELPETFKKYGSPPISWNSIYKLGEIISGKNYPSETPDGTPSAPMYSVERITC